MNLVGFVQKFLFKSTVPVLHITGPILQKTASQVERQLKKINPSTAKAIAVVINSPGGLPGQSQLIYSKIKNFAKDHHLPIYTFAEDIAASGGYFILCMGDRVYVDQTSLVGSIGVVGQWYGLKKIINLQGIENRKYASNEQYLILIIFTRNSPNFSMDVFENYNQENVNKLIMPLLKNTHYNFIQHVENYRKLKIKAPQNQREKQIYNAEIFSGNQAVDLGLADYIGNYQKELTRLYPDCRIQILSSKTTLEQIKENYIKIYTRGLSQTLSQLLVL